MNLIRRALGQRVGVIDSYKSGIPYAHLSVEDNVQVVLYGEILDMSHKWVTTWEDSYLIYEHTWGVGYE